MTTSSFTWYCGTGLPGEVMTASLEAYHFEPHFHDAWSIGAIVEGSCAFSCRGMAQVAREGDLVVMPPRAVHTGGTSDGVLLYGMAYIQTGWFDDHAALLFDHPVQFVDVVIRDPSLCERWASALTRVELADGARKNGVSVALLELLARHGVAAGDAVSVPSGVDACAELQASMDRRDVSKAAVGVLARRWGMHRTTLSKQFARRYGLPPDAWLRNWRAAQAKALIVEGMELAEVAAATGFADQAHLTRVFKRIHGVAPGVFRGVPTGG